MQNLNPVFQCKCI